MTAAAPDVRVVVFLSARCPCSMSHEPVLRELYKKFSPKGVHFEGVHSNQDEENAQVHFDATDLGFRVAKDPGAERANELGALKTPHAFVFADNKLIYRGGIDNSQLAPQATKFYLHDAIEAALEGKTPAITEARALGCLIKR